MKWIARAFLVACLSGGLPALADTPKNTLVMAKAIDDIVSMDPAEVYELSNSEVVVNVYDRLMGLEMEDMTKLVPTGAESYTVSDDGKTFTFKLRAGLTFHSGSPVTAEDVLFSYQRVLTLGLTPAYILQSLGWTADNFKDMGKAVDDRTVQLTIGVDLAPSLVLNVLSTTVSSIVDKKEVLAHEVNGDLGHEWLKTNSAGSGAFKMLSWKANDSIVLQREKTFRRGEPTIERVIIRHVPEASSQRLLLEKGDIDIARNLTADQIQGIASNPDIKVEASPKATIYYLGMSQKIEPLQKVQVRQALKYLIDYQGMADTFLKNRFKVHQSVWPSGFFASLTDTPFKLDVAKAKALLTEAGYPNGFDLELDAPNVQPFVDIAQSIQSTFAQAGIRLKIISEDTKQALTKYRARQHQTIIMYWGPDFLDPSANVDSFANNPDNSDNSAGKPLVWRNSWDIPELSKETVAAAIERDGAKREKMYLDIQKKLQDEGPYAVMFQEMEQIARRANVNGFFSGPNADLVYFYNVTK